ncbi:MAG: carbohydrate kinase [Alphaproteobacteria bacterium]|nr:carbohydrate kinase [Alphaproteobacteria bacterium]
MSTADLVIGVDCSTTASKAVVWDMAGRAVATGRRAYGLGHVRSGWVEQHAPDWWTATSAAIAEAASQVGGHRIAAIGITHQRETFVCLDQAGEPIRPAITWMDVRATAEVEAFGTSDVHRITGKPPNPTPAWYKLLWLGKHEPATIARTAHAVDVAGYLVQKLTGEWVTSWACADPLGLVDLGRFDYDDGLLGQAGLSRGQVSRLLPPGGIAGRLTADVGALLGLPAGVPVVVGAGDGQSAGLGCNVTRPGRAYLNLGTGTVSGVYAADYTHDTAYRTMGGPVPGTYILETFVGGGTQNIVWFIENFADLARKTAEGPSPEQVLEGMAKDISIGAGGLLCLPYWTGAMTPYWDGHARGAFVGVSGLHGKAHMYRAILEGIALEQRLLTGGVEKATGKPINEILMLGGGSRSPLWCQIIADTLGRTVSLVREQESTALGAGIHAAAAAGLHSDIRAAADAMTGVETSFEPDPVAHARYSDIFQAYVGIYPGLRSTFHRMAGIAQ